ncbi:MAG: glycerol-3-phosphate dehydrogenase/oxidase [Candidatus Helarchaeota archaeon]
MSQSIENIIWSGKNRNKYIIKLKEIEFDLVIIGGGITGAGIFRDITMRNALEKKGLQIALIEKVDFAYGTSNRSTKLAHGGIRYLAYGEFDLVKESESERDWLRNDFQNLVRPQSFIYPAYKKYETRSTIKMALSIYDKLADNKNYMKYKWLSNEELIELEPNLNIETTRGQGAGLYYDTNINDARLTLESIKEGIYYGGLAISHIEVKSLLKNKQGKIIGIKVFDNYSKEEFSIKSRKVVNATGVWVDNFLERDEKIIRPTKGVHIIVPLEKVGCQNAIIIRSIDDDRHFFCIPRGNFALIGTTDTDYSGTFDEVYCTQEDSDYMTRSVKYYYPKAKLDNDDIISSYAGLRPLIKETGKSESEVSRKHQIIESENGLITISGGKLTIFRKMAEELVQKIIDNGDINLPFKENLTKRPFLISFNHEDYKKFTPKIKIDKDILDHLYQEYGKGVNEILKLLEEKPELKDRIIEDRFFILGEIYYILEHEFAYKLIDVLYRRTEIWMLIHPKDQSKVSEKVSNLMASYFGWSEERKKEEIAEYLKEIYKNSFFYKESKTN